MTERIWLGAAVGTLVSAIFWFANQRPQTVSTFPDLVTLLVLVALMFGAIRFSFSRVRPQSIAAAVKAGGTIASAAGVVFGATVVTLGAMTFTRPDPVLLAFGFLTAFVSSLVCGAMATGLTFHMEASK